MRDSITRTFRCLLLASLVAMVAEPAVAQLPGFLRPRTLNSCGGCGRCQRCKPSCLPGNRVQPQRPFYDATPTFPNVEFSPDLGPSQPMIPVPQYESFPPAAVPGSAPYIPIPEGGQPFPDLTAPLPPEPTPADPLPPTGQSGFPPADGEPLAPIPDSPQQQQPTLPVQAPDLQAPAQGLDANQFAGLGSDFGASGSNFNVPGLIGDNFGGGSTCSFLGETVIFNVTARGDVVNGTLGDSGATIVFEVGPDMIGNDFTSVGIGEDLIAPNPDADTFSISEPIPPSDAPISPGPGFAFDGGTATNPSGTFGSNDIWDIDYSFTRQIKIVLPNPGAGGAGANVGRLKIAENTSPIPRDRVFFNFSYFDNVPLSQSGVNVKRFTPGFEKTLLGGMVSFELRVPFASTLESEIIADGITGNDVELGNMFMAFKVLLLERESWIVSAGLSMTVPTADDLTVSLANGTNLLGIENQSVHLMPFLGGLWQFNDGTFVQGFMQVDVDLNGNPVSVNQGNGLRPLESAHDATFFYFDIAFGKYINRCNRYRAPNIRAMIPTVEFHYTRSLDQADVLRSGAFVIGEDKEDIQLLNMVLGNTFRLVNNNDITVAYGVPIGSGMDQQFDGEFRFLWNRYF